jgi:hypothetical protein
MKSWRSGCRMASPSWTWPVNPSFVVGDRSIARPLATGKPSGLGMRLEQEGEQYRAGDHNTLLIIEPGASGDAEPSRELRPALGPESFLSDEAEPGGQRSRVDCRHRQGTRGTFESWNQVLYHLAKTDTSAIIDPNASR